VARSKSLYFSERVGEWTSMVAQDEVYLTDQWLRSIREMRALEAGVFPPKWSLVSGPVFSL